MNTNAIPVDNTDVQQALETLIQALFPHVSAGQIVSLITAIFLIARFLRKAIPDNVQQGIWGTVLKHCALEINPANGKTIPAPSNAPTQPAPKA